MRSILLWAIGTLVVLLMVGGLLNATDGGTPTSSADDSALAPFVSGYFYDPPPNDVLDQARGDLAKIKAIGVRSGPWPGAEPYYYAPSADEYLREPEWKVQHPDEALPERRYRSGAKWVTEREFNKTAYAYAVALAEAAVEQAERQASSADVRFGWRREIIENVVEPCLDVAARNNTPSNADPRTFKILLRHENKDAQERLVDETIPKVKDLARPERAAIYGEMRRECVKTGFIEEHT